MNNPDELKLDDVNSRELGQSTLFENIHSFLSSLDKNGETRLPQRAYLATRHAIPSVLHYSLLA